MSAPSEESLFDEAIQLPQDQRDAFLDQACAGDEKMRQRLQALLAAHHDPDSLLETEELAPNRDQKKTEMPNPADRKGWRIGNYKLLQQIGEGGFGIVYMAEQEQPVRRKVALKIIKPGMDTEAVVARFEAERQALAMMDHPNIAKVFDGGAIESDDKIGTGERPYFVMELVKGVPITEYCDQNLLSTRERLDLFRSVCQAVQHAHQKGIIHRDIKPSNVMVTLHDGQPMVKVIDFGVAKAIHQRLTEKTMFTEYGQMIGTPQYMSPEQAEMSGLDVDTRSDIYSLGVLLYELLTGTTPLESKRIRYAGYAEMQRMIREEELPKPSTRLSTAGDNLTVLAKHRSVSPERLNKDIRGDLDWIAMRALEKDRNRRYQSAADLAKDIQRSLENQPIEAGRPSMAYRTRKFVIRNRAKVLTTAIGLMVLMATVGLVTYQWNQNRQIVKENTLRLNTAVATATRDLERFQNSHPFDDSAWDVAEASEHRVNLLLEEKVEKGARVRANGYSTKKYRAQFDRLLGRQIEKVVIGSASHPDLETWERMERDFAEIFRRQGIDFEKETPEEIGHKLEFHVFSARLIDALELWIGTKGQISSLGGTPATRETMQPMADALYAADRDPLRTGIRKLIYDPGPWTLADVETFVSGADLTKYSARTMSWLAYSYQRFGDSERAHQIFHDTIIRYPKDVMLNIDYALLHQSEGNWEHAVRYYLRSTALRSDVSGVWRGLGVALRHVSELEQSRSALRKAVDLEQDHGATWIDLAETELALKDHASAVKSALKGTQLTRKSPLAFGCLGRVNIKLERYDDALVAFKKCKQLMADNPKVVLPVDQWISECQEKIEQQK